MRCPLFFQKKFRLRKRSNGVKKGFALITVLAVMLVLILGIAAILQATGSHTNMKSNNLKELQAQYLAEAGMQRALWRCRKNNGNCSTANESITETVGGQSYTITTTATLAGSSYNITVTVPYSDV